MAINHWEPGSESYWSADGSWSLGHVPLATEDVTFDSGDTSNCEVDENAVAKSVTISDGYTGTWEVKTSVTLDIGGSFTSDATFKIINYGTIEGCVDFGSATLLLDSWQDEGIITVDQDGTLDLGVSTINQQAVTVTAETVAVGGSFKCKSFTLNAAGGTLTGADKTITAIDVTWAGGALDAEGTLNVEMVGEGGLVWSGAGGHLGTVTFSGTTTAGDTLVCQKIAGSGTAIGNSQYLDLFPAADDFWTLETEADGFMAVYVYLGAANRKNATLIDIGSSPFVLYQYAKNLTLTGGLACGTVTLACNEGAATLDMDGGNLNCTAFYFDEDDGTFLAGSGNIVIAGVIERKDGDETGCSIDFETSHVTLGDDLTLAFAETSGTVDFGSAYISGAVTIDGTDAATIANTNAVITQATVQNLTAPAANPLYVYKDWGRQEPERQISDNRFPGIPDAALNGLVGTGNTNVEYALITYDGHWYNRRIRGIRARGRRTTPMGGRRRHLARGRP